MCNLMNPNPEKDLLCRRSLTISITGSDRSTKNSDITAKMSKPPVKNMKELTYSNPVVFFDISIGNVPQGRMKMELYADRVPKYILPFKSTSNL